MRGIQMSRGCFLSPCMCVYNIYMCIYIYICRILQGNNIVVKWSRIFPLTPHHILTPFILTAFLTMAQHCPLLPLAPKRPISRRLPYMPLMTQATAWESKSRRLVDWQTKQTHPLWIRTLGEAWQDKSIFHDQLPVHFSLSITSGAVIDLFECFLGASPDYALKTK